MKDLKIRFLDKVVPEPNTGCWLWIGCTNKDGYGRFMMNNKVCNAHRVSYEIFLGSINNYQVLHKCDTPSCVNPQHLFLGTHADNMIDKTIKGRSKNAGKPRSKHEKDRIRAMRGTWFLSRLTPEEQNKAFLLRNTMNQIQIGKILGVHSSNISRLFKKNNKVLFQKQ